MSVRVKIFHAELQRSSAAPGEVRVEGATVGECLARPRPPLPGRRAADVRRRGRLHKRFYVFVNQESMFKADFNRPVTEKDS